MSRNKILKYASYLRITRVARNILYGFITKRGAVYYIY